MFVVVGAFAGAIHFTEIVTALIQDVKVLNFDSARSFALARLIEQNIDSDAVTDLGITVPIGSESVSLGSNRTLKYVKSYFQRNEIKWDESTSLNVYSSH